MLRVIKVLVLSGLLAVFGVQNWENVPVYLLFGPPTRVRLVFLLVMAAATGYLVAVMRGARREINLARENRQLRSRLRPFLDSGKRERDERIIDVEAACLDEDDMDPAR